MAAALRSLPASAASASFPPQHSHILKNEARLAPGFDHHDVTAASALVFLRLHDLFRRRLGHRATVRTDGLASGAVRALVVAVVDAVTVVIKGRAVGDRL